MSAWHECRTCGTIYPCNSRWCPGCGKPLGHREPRGNGTTATAEVDGYGEMYRCGACGEVTLDVPLPRWCAHCGARFTEYVDGADVAAKKQARERTRKLFAQAAKRTKKEGAA